MDSVASRYAIALLSLAREENKVMPFISQCEQIVEIMNENDGLERIIKDYGLKADEKKETIDLCFKGKIDEYILNLFYVIIDNKRGNVLKDVLEEFIRIGYKELNIKKGVVYTTISLSEKDIKQLEEKVSSILNAKVTLTNKIDPQLVGGFKIQVEDYIFDDSIKNRLEKLKEQLYLKKGE